MNTSKKKLPKFRSYEEEARFWDTHDLTDFGEMQSAEVEFMPKLNKSLNVRFNTTDINHLRRQAESMGVRVSTLVRVIVRQHLQANEQMPVIGG